MSYIKGEVTYQIYYNDRTMYGVYKINIEETDESYFDFQKTATITGSFKPLENGVTYLFNGSMVFNQKYGYTFVCDTYERILPTSREGLIEFLSGDNFKGIGKNTATKVVDTLGLDAISLILESKEVLNKVDGMNEKKKRIIYDSLVESRDVQNTLITLYSYGISPKISMRIYDKFGVHSIDVIKTNPYQLIDEVEGIAFIKADQIALKTGISTKSKSRIEACISYTLINNADETGNTIMDKEELILKVRRYLSFSREETDLIKEGIESLISKDKIYEYGDYYIDARLYNSEKYIAKKLLLMKESENGNFTEREIDSLIKNTERQFDIVYEREQKDAIKAALLNKVSIITGGPGTGKTTIERGILAVYHQLMRSDYDSVKLCAPTGKAAKRIEESTLYPAQTIHKLLGYDTMGNFYYGRMNTLPVKLLIVDEASMIDIYLFKRLLEALEVGTRIVIVGDSDQLPSIGPGQVLKDLIDSDTLCTTRLTKIHRQKANSKIISLAYDVIDGEITTELDEEHDELTFIKTSTEDFLPTLENVVNHYTGMGYDLYSDIQILIPIYKGGVGIDAVNRYMQMNYNMNFKSENMDNSYDSFYIDDKVIQLSNQYEDGVMNGDMGIISDKLGDREVSVDFQGTKVTYKNQDLGNINLAYAISIHKSQGSEFKVVIIPYFQGYKVLLNKRLTYTAITRAKEHLVLMGDFRCFRDSIKIKAEDRLTTLKNFLIE